MKQVIGTEPAKTLTIREKFAMAAMQGLNANPEHASESSQTIANWAVCQADLLIQELNKPKP